MKLLKELLPEVREHVLLTTRSPDSYLSSCDYFESLWGDFRLDQITKGMIEDWIDLMLNRRDRPWKPATVRHKLSLLSRCYKLAKRRGYYDENPASRLKWPVSHYDPHDFRILEREEEIRLRWHMEAAPWEVVEFAVLTGLRGTEQFSLEPEDISEGRCKVRLGKNGRPRTFPLDPRAADIARRWANVCQGRYLFGFDHHGENRLAASREFTNRWLLPACERAGIKGMNRRALRHTFGTRLGRAGVPIQDIAFLMGHENISQTRRYVHQSQEGFLKALSAI